MKGIDIDEMAFGMPDDTGAGDDLGGIGGEGVGTDGADGAAGMDDDPMSVLRRNPTVRNMVTVTFTRDAFLKRLDTAGLDNPEETYRMFGAVMDVDGEGGLNHQRRLRLGGQPVLSHRIPGGARTGRPSIQPGDRSRAGRTE